MTELKPYLAHLGKEGFIKGANPRPNSRHFYIIEIKLFHFYKNGGDIDYWVPKNDETVGESLWIGGMQKWVVDNLYIVRDPQDEGLNRTHCVFYYFMNNQQHLTMLGKLKENPFLDAVENAIAEFKLSL